MDITTKSPPLAPACVSVNTFCLYSWVEQFFMNLCIALFLHVASTGGYSMPRYYCLNIMPTFSATDQIESVNLLLGLELHFAFSLLVL